MGSLLLLVFGLLLLLSFGAAAMILRIPAEQKLVQQRLDTLLSQGRSGTESDILEALIKPEKAKESLIGAKLHELKLVGSLQRLVYQSTGQRRVTPTVLACFAAALLALCTIDAISGMLPIAVTACVIFGAAPLVWLTRRRQKRLKAFDDVLPDAIDLCTRALHAGHSLIAAVGMVADQGIEPVKSEFAEIFRKQNYGLPLREALLDTLERVPSADLRIFITGILVQKDTGGNLTEIFDRIVHVIRERTRIAGEIRIHTAQGRLTAWILTLLPPTLLLVINIINPGYSAVLFHDPTGRALLYTGMALLLVGGIVVRRIVNGIEV